PAVTAAPLAAPVYTAPAASPDIEILEVTKMRSRIASRMLESKQQTPHFYVTAVVDVEALLALRAQINAALDDERKVSVNDLIVKAAALTLRQFPNLNSHFYGDKIVRYKRINVGIAVALPQGGLMNVVSKDADKTSISTIARQNKEMIARARDNKVRPDDIQGSTFTVSNLGAYDVDEFAAIINPPEAAILAVSTAAKVPVVKADGTLGVGSRMKLTVSVDHRVSDGAEGAQFLQALKKLLETPMQLLV
ncbi:MAG: 2-oxo acid dehydrogenase subunit E2, partial [Anaerolineae bacterium]|nr:2-oxo acid dehydrogenase subunit E2 [Anaerolineae bacterium]